MDTNNITSGITNKAKDNNSTSKNIQERKIVGRKKDKIYVYFTKDINKHKYYCNINNCNKFFSNNSSTSTLKNHVITKQCDYYNNIINKDTNIKFTSNMKNKINIQKAYSRAFAKNSLPHSLLENKYFNEFITAIKENPEVTISKRELRELIIFDGNKLKSDIIQNLKNSKQPITLAFDGWTNVRTNKVINLMLIANGNIYYYDSIENKEKQNTKEYLLSLFIDKINKLLNEGLNLIAITTDNEILMKSTCNDLVKTFPILLNIPCSAHLIQLCLKNICNSKTFKTTVDKLINLLNSFKNNKQNRLNLSNLQLADNIKIPLKIIYPTMVRWSSIIISIERILELKKYIVNIPLCNNDDNFWEQLLFFYDSIKEIKNYTNIIQKDNSSLHTVLNCFNKMITFYSSKKNDAFSSVVNIIDQYWTKYIDKNLINVIKLLCFEFLIKPEKELREFISSWGALYLQKYNLTEEKNEEKVKKILSIQLNRLIVRQKEFSKLEELIAETNSDEENVDNLTYVFKLVWGKLMTHCYELSKVAIAILSICPSEACVERSFSILSNIHTLERNNLREDLIDAELSIKINLKH